MRTVLAADLGATNLRAALIGEGGDVLELRRSSTPRQGVVDAIVRLVEDMADRASSMGLASVGPMDIKKGVLLNPPNLKERGEIEVVRRLSDRLGIDVVLLNDAVAGAIGEWTYGAGKGLRDVVYLTFSTGLGAGVIIDGRPLLGRRGNAHEAGHLVVDYRGRIRCGCGGIGHWEAYCSGSGLPKLASLVAQEHPELRGHLGRAIESGASPDASSIFRAAREGDPLALEVVREFSAITAAGIASVASAYDPELVILGGPVYLQNRDLLDGLLGEYLPEYSLDGPPALAPAALGDLSPLMGAAAAALSPALAGSVAQTQ
ncbi:MAG: ROK family protein [Conexivisphaera sp.]